MYKTLKDEYYLQIFLRKPDEEYPKAEEILGCGKKCTLDKFYEVYKELIPDEFEIECGVNQECGMNSAVINENSCMFSIVLYSLCFINKLFSKICVLR